MIQMKYDLKDSRTGGAAVYRTAVGLERGKDYLAFSFDCEHSSFFCPYGQDNAPIYNGDVCEAFICGDEEGREYLEVEVAPNETTFTAWISNENGKIKAELADGILYDVRVVKDGNGYKAAFKVDLKKAGLADKDLRLNLYRIETDGGETNKHLFALTPTLCETFHCPESFAALKQLTL